MSAFPTSERCVLYTGVHRRWLHVWASAIGAGLGYAAAELASSRAAVRAADVLSGVGLVAWAALFAGASLVALFGTPGGRRLRSAWSLITAHRPIPAAWLVGGAALAGGGLVGRALATRVTLRFAVLGAGLAALGFAIVATLAVAFALRSVEGGLPRLACWLVAGTLTFLSVRLLFPSPVLIGAGSGLLAGALVARLIPPRALGAITPAFVGRASMGLALLFILTMALAPRTRHAPCDARSTHHRPPNDQSARSW